MEKRELTCVVCPAGCRITVEMNDDGSVSAVTGNTCLRGKKYAESEVTHPVRTLTSTVPVLTAAGRKMLPVRTDAPISRESLFDAMEQLRGITVSAPVSAGDRIVCDFIEPGVNLIACKDFK